MNQERAKSISPIVDHYWPDLDDAAKERMTEVLRPYFRVHYEIYCRLDRDGLLNPDSPDSEESDRLGVAENPAV